MKKIKFSHDYYKLVSIGRPTKAVLLAVFETNRTSMHEKFIEYDCAYLGPEGSERYKLPSGPLLVLLFYAGKGKLFTTIRSKRGRYAMSKDKEQYYRSSIGETFEVVYGI